MGVVQRRRELRAEAKTRATEVLPRLRDLVKKARSNHRHRVRKCANQCKAHRARVQANAVRARQQLRERIAAAKAKAREACGVCRVDADERGLDSIDKALAAVQTEREAIADLRGRASRMKSSRGRAGGVRAAELRSESDDAVRRELGDDDAAMLALWERQKGKVKGSAHRSRTEAFLEWVHDHPEAYAEELRALEAQWEQEAEDYYRELADVRASKLDDEELADHVTRLNRAKSWLDEVPF